MHEASSSPRELEEEEVSVVIVTAAWPGIVVVCWY